MFTELRATATRSDDGKTLEVRLTGKLPDLCTHARIADIYPGGDRVYVRDPGAAQVFLEVWREEGFCAEVITDWSDTARIPDTLHNFVEVYVNELLALTIPVEEKPKGADSFIVIALTGSEGDRYAGCRIVPEDAIYPAIYSRVAGPMSREQCEAFLRDHCGDEGVFATGPHADREGALKVAAGSPLARLLSAHAVRLPEGEDADLILVATGKVSHPEHSELILQRLPNRILPPMFALLELRPGEPTPATGEYTAVTAARFPSEGRYDFVYLTSADDTISVPLASLQQKSAPSSATLKEAESSGGMLESRPVEEWGQPVENEWRAIHDFMPGSPPTLMVTGQVVVPGSGWRALLRNAVPQGFNPWELVLDLVLLPPDEGRGYRPDPKGGGEKIDVRYEVDTAFRYRTALIRTLGLQLPVEDVH
jgi:hypothetical protein